MAARTIGGYGEATVIDLGTAPSSGFMAALAVRHAIVHRSVGLGS